MSIEVRNISKQFDQTTVLKDINLKIGSGELIALLGPSGSGKTTLLRIIAGLESANAGSILFEEADKNLRAENPQVGFVFQHYALFRHMTVFENVAFGLRVRPRKARPSKASIQEKVTELLKLVQLEGLAKRYPSQLSGGQRQRIALARALAVEPQVLLLDEPFGALDARVRQELRRWLRRLHDELHITSIFVTHDQEEALEVADRVVIMSEGRIEQVGTPEEVYDRPATPFVYNFMGNVNLFHGRVQEGRMKVGPLDIATPEHAGAESAPAVGFARPHEIDIQRQRNGSPAIDAIDATVKYIFPIGPIVRLELERKDNGGLIEAELSKEQYRELDLQQGERVYVKPKSLRVFVEDYVI